MPYEDHRQVVVAAHGVTQTAGVQRQALLPYRFDLGEGPALRKPGGKPSREGGDHEKRERRHRSFAAPDRQARFHDAEGNADGPP